MYTHIRIAGAANHAAIDCYHLTSNTLLDSTARFFDLYRATGAKAIGFARHEGSLPGFAAFREIAPGFLMDHLRLAGHACEDFIRLVETQVHATSGIARLALDKTAQMAPPLVEIAIDTTEAVIGVGESAADELGEASRQAVGRIGSQAARSPRAKAGGRGAKASSRAR